MSDQEFKVSDSFFFDVAEEALTAVNQCWQEILEAHQEAVGDEEASDEEDIEHEIYLYVSVDGDWAIDHSQYFSRFHIFTLAGIYHYEDVDTLQCALESNADWDMIKAMKDA